MRIRIIACLTLCLLACVLSATPASPPDCPECTPCPLPTPCPPCETAVVSTPIPHPIDATTLACLEENQTTLGMANCMGDAYSAWDAELNRVYQELLSELTPEQHTSLRAAQVQWLAYRDQEFAWINALYDSLDGTMYTILRIDRRVQIVKSRTQELQSYLEELRFE